MLVCWRNWAGDTRLVLRNDFSMADTFHEPARFDGGIAGPSGFPSCRWGLDAHHIVIVTRATASTKAKSKSCDFPETTKSTLAGVHHQ